MNFFEKIGDDQVIEVYVLLIVFFGIYIASIPVYLFLHRYFPYVYYPNEEGDKKHRKTKVLWLLNTIFGSSSDTIKKNGIKAAYLLGWKGNCIYFFLFLFLTSIPLVPFYYRGEEQIVFNLSASELMENDLFAWTTFGYSLLISLFIIFMLIFHRLKYFSLTQKHRRLGGRYLAAVKLSGISRCYCNEDDLQIRFRSTFPDHADDMISVRLAYTYPDLLKKRLKYHDLQEEYRTIIEKTQYDPSHPPSLRPSRYSLPGIITLNQKVDALHYIVQQLQLAKTEITILQQYVLSYPLNFTTGTVFLLFRSIKARKLFQRDFEARPQKLRGIFSTCSQERARPLEDILWNNLHSSKLRRTLWQLVSNLFMVIFAIVWSIPVSYMIEVPNYLQEFLPFTVKESMMVGFVSGTLLPIVLSLLMFEFVPHVARWLTLLEKQHCKSDFQTSSMLKLVFFLVSNYLVVIPLFTYSIPFVQTIQSHDNPFLRINWKDTGALRLLALDQLLLKLIKKIYYRNSGTPLQKASIHATIEPNYHEMFAYEQLFISICIMFSPIVPLLALIGLIFYVFNYLHDKIIIRHMTSFDPFIGGKMRRRFGLFIAISLAYSYVCWTFFFIRYDPGRLGVIAGPLYFLNYVIFLTFFYWSKPLTTAILQFQRRKEEHIRFSMADVDTAADRQNYKRHYRRHGGDSSSDDDDDRDVRYRGDEEDEDDNHIDSSNLLSSEKFINESSFIHFDYERNQNRNGNDGDDDEINDRNDDDDDDDVNRNKLRRFLSKRISAATLSYAHSHEDEKSADDEFQEVEDDVDPLFIHHRRRRHHHHMHRNLSDYYLYPGLFPIPLSTEKPLPSKSPFCSEVSTDRKSTSSSSSSTYYEALYDINDY